MFFRSSSQALPLSLVLLLSFVFPRVDELSKEQFLAERCPGVLGVAAVGGQSVCLDHTSVGEGVDLCGERGTAARETSALLLSHIRIPPWLAKAVHPSPTSPNINKLSLARGVTRIIPNEGQTSTGTSAGGMRGACVTHQSGGDSGWRDSNRITVMEFFSSEKTFKIIESSP